MLRVMAGGRASGRVRMNHMFSTDDHKGGSLSRRGFLKVAAAGVALGSIGARAGVAGAAAPRAADDAPAGGKRRKIPIALELYSVRDHCAKDMAGVLAQLGK